MHMKYRAEIDGLRALAVLPVILFHAGFEWFGGGFVGVDVFFVISGYLITTIIISEMDEGKFSIVNFYERRARRILPALFFVMAVCIPFAWYFMLWRFPRIGSFICIKYSFLVRKWLLCNWPNRKSSFTYMEFGSRGTVLYTFSLIFINVLEVRTP